MEFTKMQATGNDFILINCRGNRLVQPARFAKRFCRRRFGIGADQLLLLLPSKKADFRMRIFNPDGSEAEICGNGLLCLARYIRLNKLSKKRDIEIELMTGTARLRTYKNKVVTDMGEPRLEGKQIPARLGGKIISRPMKVGGKEFRVTCVNLGNPHCITFVGHVEDFPVGRYGPLLENHRIFPNRINVEFIEVINKGQVKLRVWERGCGETLGCGSGASASVVAGVLNGKTGRKVKLMLPGGLLEVEWGKDNHLYLSGEPEVVFTGEISSPRP
ncbi:MAG: diaminopimelate epimerase [Deltaproteobacteria bacterium]|nr:MAG: diaminopimelate epimerase [Deltaproteobacteria bacterium]